MDKKETRICLSEIRKGITDRNQKEALVAQKLMPLIKDKSIFIYVSFGSELSTHSIICAHKNSMSNTAKSSFNTTSSPCDGAQKYIAVPQTQNGIMRAKKLLYFSSLEVNPRNGNLPDAQLGEEVTAPEVAIVPMLGFSKSCYRLGYGGGYYDKFLARYVGKKIGIAFDEQLFDIPLESFDVPLDAIITPNNIYLRKESL